MVATIGDHEEIGRVSSGGHMSFCSAAAVLVIGVLGERRIVYGVDGSPMLPPACNDVHVR